VVDKKSSNL